MQSHRTSASLPRPASRWSESSGAEPPPGSPHALLCSRHLLCPLVARGPWRARRRSLRAGGAAQTPSRGQTGRAASEAAGGRLQLGAGGRPPGNQAPATEHPVQCSGFSPWGFEFLLCLCFILLCPRRCYENLRPPAGKVTSLGWCCLSPGHCLGPCSGWGGFPSTRQLLTLRLSFLSPPPPPNLPPLRAGSLVLSVSPLSPAREISGGIFRLRRGPGLLAPPLMSLFPVNLGPEFTS